MNERIKQIYQEARGISRMGDSFMEEWEYKFAELIVQECIKHINEGLANQKEIAHLFDDGAATLCGMEMAIDILQDSIIEG
jgi:hypothetical protein